MSDGLKQITPADAAIILAVCEAGTTVGAAQRMHLTQSAVSKAVSRVETLLGVKIFDRDAGGLRPRSEARELISSVQAVDREWRCLEVSASLLKRGDASTLSIITTPSIGHGVLARALGRLKRSHPKARVRLEMGDPIEVLRAGGAEIAFMFSPRVGPDMETMRVMNGRMVVMLHRDDPLARHASLRLSDLPHQRLICFDRHKSPLGWLVAQAFDREQRLYAPNYVVPYSLTATHLAANGCGVAVVDDFVLLGQAFDDLVQRPLEPEIPIEITMMWVRNQPRSQLAKALISGMEAANQASVATFQTNGRGDLQA